MRLIDADAMQKIVDRHAAEHPNTYWLTCYATRLIAEAATIDAVPVDKCIQLRNSLYAKDNITMAGLKEFNELLAKEIKQNESR